jgi:hypothetical protein
VLCLWRKLRQEQVLEPALVLELEPALAPVLVPV